MSERRGGGLLRLLRGPGQSRLEDAPGHIVWTALRGARRGNAPSRPVPARPAGSGRDAWRHPELQVRPVAIDTTKDPRYRRERSGGYGSTAPYLPGKWKSPKTCRPVEGQPRTSVAFRQFRRAGFQIQQRGGLIWAVPATTELIKRIGRAPVEIGRTIV